MYNLRDGDWKKSMVKKNFIKRYNCKSGTQLIMSLGQKQGLALPEDLDSDIKKFINQCCVFDRLKRPSAARLLKSKFFNN